MLYRHTSQPSKYIITRSVKRCAKMCLQAIHEIRRDHKSSSFYFQWFFFKNFNNEIKYSIIIKIDIQKSITKKNISKFRQKFQLWISRIDHFLVTINITIRLKNCVFWIEIKKKIRSVSILSKSIDKKIETFEPTVCIWNILKAR